MCSAQAQEEEFVLNKVDDILTEKQYGNNREVQMKKEVKTNTFK